MDKKIKHSDFEWIDQMIGIMAERAASEFQPTPLKSRENFHTGLQQAMDEGFTLFYRRIESGVTLLLDAKAFPECTDTEGCRERFSDPELLRSFLEEGHSFEECFGFDERGMAKAYEQALLCYKESRFDAASDILLFLTTLSPLVLCFWTALGMAEQQKGDLTTAATAYLMGLDPEAPDLNSYLYASDCLVELGSSNEAQEILKEALSANDERFDPDPQFTAFAQQRLAMIKGGL